MNKTFAFVALSCSSLVFAQAPADVPEAVRPPTTVKVSMHTVGAGEITYECRLKAGSTDAYEWAFVAPVATLKDKTNKVVGKYYAGPTWEANDGSKITGKQVAIAPATAGSIPLQLVKTEPATGQGAMTGVSYIQRVNTKGGVAPTDPCNKTALGNKKQVSYEADYVFYK